MLIIKSKRQAKGFIVSGCVFGTCMACFAGGYFSSDLHDYSGIALAFGSLLMSISCARMVNYEFTKES